MLVDQSLFCIGSPLRNNPWTMRVLACLKPAQLTKRNSG
jgi:hypothetical protein